MYDWIKEYGPLITVFGTVATIVMTIFNIVMGLRTAGTARKNLDLARHQFAKQWHPELHAKATSHAAHVHALELSNLGKMNLLVRQILVRRSGIQSAAVEKFTYEGIIPAGKSLVIPVTRELREYLEAHKPGSIRKDTIEFAFRIVAAKEEFTTDWFKFLVTIENNMPGKIESFEEHRKLGPQ